MPGLWDTPAHKWKDPFEGMKLPNEKEMARIKREYKPSSETLRRIKMFEDGAKASRDFVSRCRCRTGGVCFFHTKF